MLMKFEKYQHIEKWGTDETEGIENGICYVFPKIDGTNGCVYVGEDNTIHAGSRNRELTVEHDNHNFYKSVLDDKRIINYLNKHPHHRLFGEWLVPHSLKTYRDDTWKKFYIFDIVEKYTGFVYLSYDEYQPLLEEFGLDYIPCQAKIKNPTTENLIVELQKNNFLIKDGEGQGEGIVIKNYDYTNKYGRITWAKLVTSEFREKHQRAMPVHTVNGSLTVEDRIIEKFLTTAMIDKVLYEILDNGAWSQKKIPELLNRVYHNLVTEEIWEILKEFGQVNINFKNLMVLTFRKVKEVKKELFT